MYAASIPGHRFISTIIGMNFKHLSESEVILTY